MLELVQGDILLTLLAIILIELVLGVDNLIILFGVLRKKNPRRRFLIVTVGFAFSIILRALVLGTALVILSSTLFLFEVQWPWFSIEVGTRGLIYFIAGVYLIFHGLSEIRNHFGEEEIVESDEVVLVNMSWPAMILWVAIIDLVFSYDSLLGVIAVSQDWYLLVIGLVISRVIMVFFLSKIYRFIHHHPELMVVMFIFLVMVGLSLFLDGLEDMEAGLFGLNFRGFPVSWLYSIFAIGIVYSWWHTRVKKRRKEASS